MLGICVVGLVLGLQISWFADLQSVLILLAGLLLWGCTGCLCFLFIAYGNFGFLVPEGLV